MHPTGFQKARQRAGLRLRHHADQLRVPIRHALADLRGMHPSRAPIITPNESESLNSAGGSLMESLDALEWLAAQLIDGEAVL